MLTELITHYRGIADTLQRMNDAIDAEEYTHAKTIHEELMAKYNRSITILSGPNWEDVRVDIVKDPFIANRLEGVDFVFRRKLNEDGTEVPISQRNTMVGT